MDADQWAQGIGVVKPMENQGPMIEERKPRPTKPQDLNCPRCHSTHTKFCYYNNYSLSQPRYFCKSCRRYWTEGGSLRNVPVGGGSRKNKRSSSKHIPHQNLVTSNFSHPYNPNPKITHEGQDLNLAYPPTGNYGNISEFVELSYNENFKSYNHPPNNALSTPSHHLSHMELLKSGIVSNTIYSSTLPFQDYKPGHNFTLDGFQSGYAGLQGTQENNSARVFFPFEELKPVSTASELDQNKGNGNGESTTGYWSGGLGGGSSW